MATGDIHEDIPQAQAAARAGADVIAVIRSTGQSLLDYVPEGATRTGYAGTYATQENFRLMRAALDDVSAELGRYVRLTNYASGLCMPEIAVLAGLERLDMMLNDAMYGILFRDINPRRTFVDQRFSRMVHARAGIIINTGEDNYLTTADAVDEAHTVTVSQLLNETLAKEAGLEDWQLGLGHAFEIDPDRAESFRLELAHALLARSLFPDAPLKWMPPTKHMTGDVFRGYLLDGFFNLAGALTGQGILLVGMMTEAVVTPWLSDRDLALRNVRYVLNAAGNLAEDFAPPPGGFIDRRADTVLREAVDLLERIADHPGGLIAGDRRRHVRHHQAAGRRRQGSGRRRRARPGRLQPGAGAARRRRRWPVPDGSIVRPVRRHHRRRDGADVVHAARAAGPEGRGRRPAAGDQDGHRAGDGRAQPRHRRGYTFFVVYGSVQHLVDLDAVVVEERAYPLLSSSEINGAIRTGLNRKIVVLGACIGTDAHTVGIDAILNVKGFAGEKGLEYLPRDGRDQSRRPGRPSRSWSPRPGPPAPTPSSSPRWSPRRTRTCATPASSPPPSARRWGSRGRCSSSAARASTRRWPPTSASTRSSAGGRRPARSPATSSTP